MSASRAAILAWFISGLTLAIVASAATLAFINRASIHSLDEASLLAIVLPIGFCILGGLVASRLPGNALGWLFLAIAFCNGLPGLTIQYSRYALITHPGAPFNPWLEWVGTLTDSLVYPAGLAMLAFLLTPNGRFLSPRWARLAWVGMAMAFVLVTLSMLDPDGLSNGGLKIPNPLGIAWVGRLHQGPVGIGLFLAGLALLVVAGASVFVRLRRSSGDERLQLRWVAYTAAASVLANAVTTLFVILFIPYATQNLVVSLVTIMGFGVALPAAFGISILRYRLYDLDLLLNRTLVYGSVSAALAVIVAVADVLAQRVAESLIHQRSDLVSVGLGLGAGIAFGPLRRRIRPMVDRFLPARSRQTLLFTDIVGSTQAIVDLGDERWRAVLDRYRTTVRHALARYRGREVNTAGDAFFAAFNRPDAAVRSAEAIRDGVRELGLKVRTGLHVGDVEMRGEQVSGLAVHAAARVMGEAGDDQILVSSDLAELLSDGVALTDAGQHSLKGVPGTWQLFAVKSPGGA